MRGWEVIRKERRVYVDGEKKKRGNRISVVTESFIHQVIVSLTIN